MMFLNLSSKNPKVPHVYAKSIKEARERGFWFKAKNYGYGWVPVTIEGWIATLAYMALIIRDVIKAVENNTSTYSVAISFVLYTILFIFITKAKGEPAKWRWGN